MPLDGDYEPSTAKWVRDQVALYESSGGTKGTSLNGRPVIILTTRGATSGKLRKTALMRVEHEGRYLAVASQGGAKTNPAWYHNVVAEPHVEVQDGSVRQDMTAHEAAGTERDDWWARAVQAFPNYAGYQTKTDRLIPVFVLTPR